jgi:hypothetical protein
MVMVTHQAAASEALLLMLVPSSSPRTVCDGTDRGVAEFSDGFVAGSVMTTDKVGLHLLQQWATVTLRAGNAVISKNLILETLTTAAGEPVTEIFFHRARERN